MKIQIKINNDQKKQMKKKLSISVADIMKGRNINSNKPIVKQPKKYHLIDQVSKSIRFQDMYKKAILKQNCNKSYNGIKDGNAGYQKCISNKKYQNKGDGGKKISNPTVQSKKSQISSFTGSVGNSGKKTVPSTIPSHRIIQSIKQNTNILINDGGIKQKNIINCTPQKQNQFNIVNHLSRIQNQFNFVFFNCIKNLNHNYHSHLHKNNDCFLSESQICQVVSELGYNVKCKKYQQLLHLLQVDIYGGTPSQNLKNILKIIQQKIQTIPKNITTLPKIIDSNLQLILTKQNKQIIKNNFIQYKILQNQYKQYYQKQSIQTPPFNNNNNQLVKINNNQIKKQISIHHYLSTQQTYSSPNKKIINPVITQLIQALSQQQNIKQQNIKQQNIKQQNSKQQNIKQQNSKQQNNKQQMQDKKKTESIQKYKKIQKFEQNYQDYDNYNFSRELYNQKICQKNDQDDIIELKNKLNQALKKPGLQTNNNNNDGKQLHNLFYGNIQKLQSKPILSIDVNLGDGISQKIIVYEGETAREVSQRLSTKYMINDQIKLKFEKILQSHLSMMLWKIDEVSQQMLTDRTDSEI